MSENSVSDLPEAIPEQHYQSEEQVVDESMETQPEASNGAGMEGGEGPTLIQEGTFAGEQIPHEEHKLFVGGLSWETNEITLQEYFSNFGTVKEINLKFDPVTKKSRGFAFVLFEEGDALKKVLDPQSLPHTIDGRQVDAKKAIPHTVHQALKNRTKKIFVGGVPTDMPKETIEAYFIQFGEIEEVALVTDKGSDKRRGFVFITFISEDSVDKCTEKSFHSLESHQVEVKRATPREQNPAGPIGGRGRGRGGGYRGGWMPYGGQYHGGFGGGGGGGYAPPYGGYNSYGGYGGGGYGGGGYGGYGGYAQQGGYEQFGYRQGGGGGQYGGGSRYGPMKHNHGTGAYHPYRYSN